MNIETKFNIDENLFFIHNNQVVKNKVYMICIEVEKNENGAFVKYIFETSGGQVTLPEHNVFSTKESLLKSL